MLPFSSSKVNLPSQRMLNAAQARASQPRIPLKSSGAYASQKLKSLSAPLKYPFSRAKVITSGAYMQFSGSSRGKVLMRAWLACEQMYPSGTLLATHTMPLLSGPFPMRSMTHTSSVSAIEKDSPLE